jgi:hypothetical protein
MQKELLVDKVLVVAFHLTGSEQQNRILDCKIDLKANDTEYS